MSSSAYGYRVEPDIILSETLTGARGLGGPQELRILLQKNIVDVNHVENLT